MKTKNLHHDSIIIDGLNASEHSDVRVIKNLHKGGVTAVNATVAAWHNAKDTKIRIDAVLKNLEKHKSIARIVRNTDDIYTCKKQNKVGYILGFQDSLPIEEDLGLLKEYYDLGLRIIQLTYNHTNYVGSGCMVANDTGLTSFGKKAIKEMNRLGILIDLSHCGYVTTKQAIEYSELPVAFTHVNPKSICDSQRNKPKELFELLAKNNGVAGAAAVPAMLTCNQATTMGDYINAIDKMVQIIGVEYVALGPDLMEFLDEKTKNEIFEGVSDEIKMSFLASKPVMGLENASKFMNITKALIAWGFKKDDIQKIIGLNWLNLYEKVWQ